MNSTTLYFYEWKSPIGKLFLYATETHLVGLLFQGDKEYFLKRPDHPVILQQTNAVIDLALQQLSEYFSGKRKVFDLPCQLLGTEFQQKVWAELEKIPYGKTITYKTQAEKIQAPKAVRAVGAANGKNPIGIIIPCHRVVGTNGKLVGYAGGFELKAKLLQIEGISNIH
ncbi:MAG: hypothetical protein A2622_11560 [Bdellovibrionales bacterium RIFCSPHIGHO2_01_FULL_40_29]|nr:MAG: hypothetical protein A2622_11560 [Bdellovibrionales bacterium RIFCSPHIGHO2_01_FULL_40_29]OFZ34609.1 MAG: hypothetical protein A3D17_01825 [Bdellovibrionales bacterium RIFCSPHIGHO2_02_FULL_40_15]